MKKERRVERGGNQSRGKKFVILKREKEREGRKEKKRRERRKYEARVLERIMEEKKQACSHEPSARRRVSEQYRARPRTSFRH